MNPLSKHDLHPAIWWWFVPLPLFAHALARQLDDSGEVFKFWFESELGLIENGTALLLIPAVIAATITAQRFYKLAQPLTGAWFFGIAAVCFFYFGEEISWGQHWLGWASPDYFVEHNRQGETNIHNLNIRLGRVAKSIVTVGIIVGGIIFALKRKNQVLKPARQMTSWDWIAPTMVCFPIAVFVFLIRIIERLKTWNDVEWPLLAFNLKENQELYIAWFFMVYALSAMMRSRALEPAPNHVE